LQLQDLVCPPLTRSAVDDNAAVFLEFHKQKLRHEKRSFADAWQVGA
jgi:hypothetical protein